MISSYNNHIAFNLLQELILVLIVFFMLSVSMYFCKFKLTKRLLVHIFTLLFFLTKVFVMAVYRVKNPDTCIFFYN